MLQEGVGTALVAPAGGEEGKDTFGVVAMQHPGTLLGAESFEEGCVRNTLHLTKLRGARGIRNGYSLSTRRSSASSAMITRYLFRAEKVKHRKACNRRKKS